VILLLYAIIIFREPGISYYIYSEFIDNIYHMNKSRKPIYPITITYSDGEIEVIHFEGEDCCGLNEFSSLDPKDPKVVVDANDEKVNLVIKNKLTIVCELI